MTSPVITTFKDTGFFVTNGWSVGAAITAISNANPAVVTRTAHGFADGDIVRHVGIVGMTELNDRICVIQAIDANTYSLEDVDSTNFGTYTSGGTVSRATLSSSCQVTNYTGATGTTPSSTVDTNCGSAKTYGVPQHGSANVQFAFAKTDFINAFKAGQKRATQVVLKHVLPLNRGITYDIGTVVSFDYSGQANGNWTGGAVIERDFARIDLEA
jgi:hypothetical protein